MPERPLKVLITCPPMIGTAVQYKEVLKQQNVEIYCPDVVQVMTENELIELVPQFDGWIIGDDPASRHVFEAGRKGRLKAAVKWGIGVDNVDFSACEDLGILITNTPEMFGKEVADIALCYVTGLARETFRIDREIRDGLWPKYRGMSLSGRQVGLVGFGDIGRNTAKRLSACEMDIVFYDPHVTSSGSLSVKHEVWPEKIGSCDFIIFTCSLNDANRKMLNAEVLSLCKYGVRIINVARGPLIDEKALIEALTSGRVHSAALDVFEVEPLPMNSPLRDFPSCILGSHNGSNTADAVNKTNMRVINHLLQFLGVN